MLICEKRTRNIVHPRSKQTYVIAVSGPYTTKSRSPGTLLPYLRGNPQILFTQYIRCKLNRRARQGLVQQDSKLRYGATRSPIPLKFEREMRVLVTKRGGTIISIVPDNQ